MVWFIHSGGQSFKMEISYDSITSATFTEAGGGVGLASFTVADQPAFFLEQDSSPRLDGSIVKVWRRSIDWTEGQQATVARRHDLIGSASHLIQLVQNLQNRGNAENAGPVHYKTPPTPSLHSPLAGPTNYSRESHPVDMYTRPLIQTYPTERSDNYPNPARPSSHPSDQLPLYNASLYSAQPPLGEQSFSSDAYSQTAFAQISPEVQHGYPSLDTHSRGSALPYHYPPGPVTMAYPSPQANIYSYPDARLRQTNEPTSLQAAHQRRMSATVNLPVHTLEPAATPPLLTTPFNPTNNSARSR